MLLPKWQATAIRWAILSSLLNDRFFFRRPGVSGTLERPAVTSPTSSRILADLSPPTMNRPTKVRLLKCAFPLVFAFGTIGLLEVQQNAAYSAETDLESELLFVRRIAPLLTEKCIACHGADQDDVQGGLDLTKSSLAQQGGDSGESALIVSHAEKSPIYLAATRDSNDWSAMPPKDSEALTAEQLSWLEQWINSGAAWPSEQRVAEIEALYEDEWSAVDGVTIVTSGGLSESWTKRRYDPNGLWAYQPVVKPALPATANSNEDAAISKHPIDQLLAVHRPENLQPAPLESRQRLIRRAYFDLTGLPPTPKQVQTFVADPRDDLNAFSEVVEQLLDSPHYGERMAQHWLDVVRYADSSGFANDYERGNAWRYRDYVIRSFNQDKPYDQFVREQIAGDELDPENPEFLIATGMLRMGPWELTGMEVAKVARQRFLDDVTNSVGETFLAHSLQCARCHDHKFDPVPTRDYYAIQAVFATTQLTERESPFIPAENCLNFEEQEYLKRRQSDYQETLAKLDQALLENASKWYAEQGFDPTDWNAVLEQLKKQGKSDQLFNAARNRMKQKGLAEEAYPPKLVGFTPEQFGQERVARKGLERLRWQVERYQPFALSVYNGRTPQVKSVYAPQRIPSDATTEGELENTCILSGGDPFSPTIPVKPAGLSVLDSQVSVAFPESIEGRRTALAQWIADPANPLTTRTIVNRIWLWHFGQGIADNPNNFGSTGKSPTHPELLDWLAATFVENKWSFKQMHRTIMLSHAYRQSSIHPNPDDLGTFDPEGNSYSVFKRRRLSAEEIRDAMLLVSGELNPKLGGIPCRPEINLEVAMQPRQVMGTFAAAWTPNPEPSDRHRRSIYTLRLRGLTDPMFDVFNLPGPDFSCEKRSSSTVTPQVFSLFNSQSSYNRAMSLAIDLQPDKRDSELNSDQIVEEAFMRLFGRQPNENELQACVDHWEKIEGSLTDEAIANAKSPPLPPTSIRRNAVEENTGERFSFEEQLYANRDFTPDHDADRINRTTVALADLCLVLMNSNEFLYID